RGAQSHLKIARAMQKMGRMGEYSAWNEGLHNRHSDTLANGACLFLLHRVRCNVSYCSAVVFLRYRRPPWDVSSRLGPFAFASGPFLYPCALVSCLRYCGSKVRAGDRDLCPLVSSAF